MVFYSRTLAVPARRDWRQPAVRRGEQLFEEAQCGACHIPTLRTRQGARTFDLPDLSQQLIHPYTDLLLHDMGAALADGRPDFRGHRLGMAHTGRCGASGWWKRSTVTLTFCTTAAPAICQRPFSGTGGEA